MNSAPKMEPRMLPSPPTMTMAKYWMSRWRGKVLGRDHLEQVGQKAASHAGQEGADSKGVEFVVELVAKQV